MPAREPPPLSVLIVEDQPDVAESLKLFLELLGYNVAVAPDGEAGVEQALAHQPAAVVCDIGLPKKDGFRVAEELTAALPRTPLLIAVTGYGTKDVEDRAHHAGFQHFITKPADPFRLEGLLREYRDRLAGRNRPGRRPPGPANRESHMVHTANELRVLVVDDNRDTADSLSMLLRMWGHRPSVAYDGAAAIEAARTDPPDAVFLDLAIPVQDGYRVAEDLRRTDMLKDVPIIAVTGFADQAHRDRAAEAGFDRYLVKPVDEPTLRRMVDELVEIGRPAGGACETQERADDALEEGDWAPGSGGEKG